MSKPTDLNDADQVGAAVVEAMGPERLIYTGYFRTHRQRLRHMIVAMGADTIPKMTNVLLVDLMKHIPEFAEHLRSTVEKGGYSQEEAIVDVMGDLVGIAGFLAGVEVFLLNEADAILAAASEAGTPPAPNRLTPDANGVVTIAMPEVGSHLVEGDQKLH